MKLTQPAPLHPRILLICATWLACCHFSASAADVIKANNPDALNLGSAWSGGTAPTTADVAVWNSLVGAANTTSSLGADLGWAGIRIANPGAAVMINAGNTLTNGTAGIDLSAATVGLSLSNNLELSAAQTWNVGNDLTLDVGGAVSGTGSLTKTGNGTLILGVAGTYSGGTTNSGGWLQLNAAAAAGTGPITLNGAVMAHSPTTGFTFNNPVVVAAGTTNMVMATNAAGSGNPISSGAWSGSGTVIFSNSYTPYTLGGSLAAFSGTIVCATPNGSQLRFNSGGGNPSTGSPDAIFDLGTGAGVLVSRNAGVTINLGALKGGPETRLQGRSSGTGGSTTYSIGAKNLDTTFEGTIANGGDATAITKVGTGKLTLTGMNSNTGPWAVNGGTLQIGNGGALGAIGSGAITLNNNASLVFSRSDEVILNNAIAGTGGSLVKLGANRLTFLGTNASATVGHQINGGTLAMGDGAVVSGPIALANGASLDVSGTTTFVLGGVLSGVGSVSGALTAGNNATLSPAGPGVAGVLNLTGGLIETDAVINSLDLSDDPTGLVKANDIVNITGNLSLSGTNSILITPLNGALANGVYTLIKYSGSLSSGGLANLTVNVAGTLTNPPGAIALIVSSVRPAASLVWKGDGAANTWDTSGSNWFNGAALDKFIAGDTVRFTDAGSNNSPINLVGILSPASITVNATKVFTFSGSGSIVGNSGITKTNSGILTLANVNGHTGPTVIGAGTLVVSNLANGGASSPIGASTGASSNLVFYGSTLRYEGTNAISDRGATLNAAGATFDITTDTENLTLGGALTGPGALMKAGPGTLTLSGANDYAGGTVLSNGVLALGSQAANGAGLGPTNSPVTFQGGTLELFGYNGANNVNYSAVRNPLVVPAGQTGTLRMFSRGPTDNTGITSPLSGGGTLNLVVNYIRGSLDGNWSAFTGSLVVTGKAGADHFRINNTFGYANASIFLNDGVTLYRNGGANTTTDIGELSGGSASFVGLNNTSQNNAAANPTWRVGAKNTSASYDGIIQNDGTTSVIKLGTGTWTLNNANLYSGSTTVSNGVLALGANGSIDNSTNFIVVAPGVLDVSARFDQTLNLGQAANQTLQGNGLLRGNLSVGGLGISSPGFSVGSLTVTGAVTLASGSTTVMELDRAGTPNCDKLTGASISLGGNLVVTNLGSGLQVGDTFDLFDGTLSGGFESVTLPSLYTFNTNNLTVNGTIVVTGAPVAPIISSVSVDPASGAVLRGNVGLALANTTYYVVASTNLTAPAATWTPVLTNLVLPDGSFSATNPIAPGTPQNYFRLLFP